MRRSRAERDVKCAHSRKATRSMPCKTYLSLWERAVRAIARLQDGTLEAALLLGLRPRCLHGARRLSDLADELEEGVLTANALLRRRLHKGAAKAGGKLRALLRRDLRHARTEGECEGGSSGQVSSVRANEAMAQAWVPVCARPPAPRRAVWPTCRSFSRSDLLPTISMGTWSESFTRRICSRNAATSLKLPRLVMLYTQRKPWPFRMYWSRIAEYSSWPAVSRMSSRHVSSSIDTCLRYESSIVGS
jgi:hypothetical protein